MLITIYGGKKKTRKQREKEKALWNAQQEKYKLHSITKKGKVFEACIKLTPLELNKDRLACNYPSKDSGIGVAVKKETNTYTGDKLIGIGSLHKSNLVPVFKEDEAKDLASMRR
jgi:hypothetical protein